MKQVPSQSKQDLGWMQGTQAKVKQVPSQSKQDLGLMQGKPSQH